jgi:hypothetical protein
MNETDIRKMFDYLASAKETKSLGNFFRQCANAYRNKYMYTSDETLKGSVLALTQLAEKFDEHTKAEKDKEELRQKKIISNKKSSSVNY